MFDSASTRAARTLLALTAATTVGLTGLAGAAQADHDHDEDQGVDVTVCKRVVDHDDHEDRSYDHRRRPHFDFTARVNGQFHDDFSLTGQGAKRCYTFEVDRGDRVRVREHRTPGYELRNIRVSRGARNVSTNARAATFRAHIADITVRFVNEKQDHH